MSVSKFVSEPGALYCLSTPHTCLGGTNGGQTGGTWMILKN